MWYCIELWVPAPIQSLLAASLCQWLGAQLRQLRCWLVYRLRIPFLTYPVDHVDGLEDFVLLRHFLARLMTRLKQMM